MALTPSPLDPLIPIIVTLLKQTGWPSRWNAWVALGVYVVWTLVSLGLGLRAVEGPITVETFLSTLMTSASIGFVSYQLFWKQLPGDAEATLELKTSLVKGPVSAPVEVDASVSDGETQAAKG